MYHLVSVLSYEFYIALCGCHRLRMLCLPILHAPHHQNEQRNNHAADLESPEISRPKPVLPIRIRCRIAVTKHRRCTTHLRLSSGVAATADSAVDRAAPPPPARFSKNNLTASQSRGRSRPTRRDRASIRRVHLRPEVRGVVRTPTEHLSYHRDELVTNYAMRARRHEVKVRTARGHAAITSTRACIPQAFEPFSAPCWRNRPAMAGNEMFAKTESASLICDFAVSRARHAVVAVACRVERAHLSFGSARLRGREREGCR